MAAKKQKKVVAKKKSAKKASSKKALTTAQERKSLVIVGAEPNPKRKGSAAAKIYEQMTRAIKKKIPVAELNKTTNYKIANFHWDLAHQYIKVKKSGRASA